MKGPRRTFLCLRHTSGYNQPSLDVLFAPIFDMAFLLGHSPLVHPRHVQVTVSRYRGDRGLLRYLSESEGDAALHSHLRHDQRVSARLRRVRVVMPGAVVSNPAYHVNPPWHPAG